MIKVFVMTAWDEKTGKDIVEVYADKAAAERALKRLDGPTIYSGVYERRIRQK